MKTIRYGTFETNSSSTHSMIIPTKLPANSVLPDTVVFNIGEFGWGYEEPNHLDYLYTAVLAYYKPEDAKEYLDRIEQVCYSNGATEVEFEEPVMDSYQYNGEQCYYLSNGYVDHSDSLTEFLETVFESDSNLLNYLLAGRVGTGNDNSDFSNPIAEFYDKLDWSEQSKYIYCYKGN